MFVFVNIPGRHKSFSERSARLVSCRSPRNILYFGIERCGILYIITRVKPQKECQSVEWKESWNDDHLKCLCAFANTSGGTLYVGIDDRGKVIRANNLHKTLEDLPNKIRNHLEIIADVSLQENKDGEYIRIDVPAYRHLVSYRGHYYYRTGSTTQELKGAALERMMLRRQRISWDSIPVPTVSIDDLSDHAFDLFRQKSVAKKREGKNILSDSKETILRNLQLITEDGHLTRAAVLLFHPHPERYVLGATVRVGFFRDESDLAYQDEFTGSLFEQVDKLEDVIFTKYLKAYISYEGFQRIERYLFPREALREGILNAVIHKDYASNNSVQIKIFEDRVIIFNAGELPENWTVKKLTQLHHSCPYNPLIASAFFVAGEIEKWGRGIETMVRACKENGLSKLKYVHDGCYALFFTALQPSDLSVLSAKEKILTLLRDNPSYTREVLAQKCGMTVRGIGYHLQQMKKNRIIQRVGSDKNGCWIVLADIGKPSV